MDKNNKGKLKFLIGVIACFAVVFFVGLGFSGGREERENEVSESFVTEQPKINVPKLYNTEKTESVSESYDEPESVNVETEYAQEAEDVFVPSTPERYIRPTEGGILNDYSEKPVYSKTLDDWRAHTGIDFAAAEGEEVKASAAGVVEDVYFDSLYGYTVAISHTGGVSTIYSNLEGDVTVAPGQNVAEGELIGYAGSTASAESGEESHVHFEMKRDGILTNPNEELE